MALEKIRPRVIDEAGNYTFNNVTATGNLVTLNANLGNVAVANYVKTDNLLYSNGSPWSFGGAVTASGSNTQVQFNNAGSLGSSANFVFDSSTNRLTVDNISGNGAALTNLTGANITGTVGNANFAAYAGNITVAAQSNITSVGTLTSLNITGNISSGNANLGNFVIANFFSGSGNNLSNIQASNVTGAVSYATTANSVAGANVSGAVAYAATANAVAGANVLGEVSFAATANSVAGANVSGFVANANVANTAYSVSAANITGTINLANFATTANSVAGANVSGFVANANVANTAFAVAGANVSGQVSNALIAGTVYTNAQPNITSVGTLSSLAVTGNISSGNANLGNLVTANFFSGSGNNLSNLTFGNITAFNTAGLTIDELYLQSTTRLDVTASGSSGYIFDQYGVTVNPVLYVTSGQTLAFNLDVTGHPFLIQTDASANYSTGLVHVDTTGTVSTTTSAQGKIAGTLYWKVPYGITGNYKYQCSIHGGMAGNIVVADANVANIQVANATIASTVYTNAQPNITSVGTLSSLAVTGNITSGNANLGNLVTANFFSGSGIYITGVAAATAATVTTNAQPNITSVGTLTSLIIGNATANTTFGNGTITATGNISFTGANVSLGDISNLKITGGTAGYFLSTDGAGNLSWGAAAGGGGVSATGSNTQLQFNDGGVLGASANLVFDKTTNTFTTGRVVASAGANLGTNVANVYIGGGSDNQILKTDGSGNLTWIAQPVATMTVDNFTGDGTTTAFTLSTAPTNINFTVVNYNGAFQLREAYSISGTTITFTEAPNNGSKVEVTTTSGATSGAGAFVTRTYTGNGVATTYTVTSGVTVSSVIVTENGLVQTPTVDYTISGTTLTFVAAPANGITIQIRELAIAIVTSSGSALTIKDEGSNLTTVAASIDFVGGGVTATNTGNAVTVTIPSGSNNARTTGYSLVFGG